MVVHIAGAQRTTFKLTDNTVHVQRDPFGWRCRVSPVDPLTRHVCQRSAIVRSCQHLGLEPSHLACRRGLGAHSPSAAFSRINVLKYNIVPVVIGEKSQATRAVRAKRRPVKAINALLREPSVVMIVWVP